MTWLWAVFTVIAAAGQTARNAMQRELTAKLGTVGATHVRFLFGCPFALIFLAGVLIAKEAPLAATFTLAVGLTVQAVLLSGYLALRTPAVLRAIALAWQPSLFAGAMGAFASQFWFLAFALTTAANVRTLALVEVLFAQAVSHVAFKQPLSARELSGIALIVVGVGLLVAA